MLIDIHTHTSKHSSCSVCDPVVLVQQAAQKRLQGIVITEHQYLWSEQEIAALRAASGIEDTFLIMAGQEVETDIGHILVFGAETTIPERTSLDELRKRYPDAALVWAHPFRNGAMPDGQKLCDPRIDAVEIFSSNHTQQENIRGLGAWHHYKFRAVAGSDAHAEDAVGVYPTLFDHYLYTIHDVAGEVRSGRCRPFLKEIPKAGSNLIVTEVTIGTKGDDETRPRMILKQFKDNGKWAAAQRSMSITRSLYEDGFRNGAFRVPRTIVVDEGERLVMEEGQRGRSLFNLLLTVDPSVGGRYFELAAEWLARLHEKKISGEQTPADRDHELRRFESYRKSFAETESHYQKEADGLIEFVRDATSSLWAEKTRPFTQLHGDYHPKNIIIGQDRMQDYSTLFISVIDFDNAFRFLDAFDVGYFLSQFQNQYAPHPAVTERYSESRFLKAYLKERTGIDDDFVRLVDLFKVRANLSIASFLIKVGKGESREMEGVMARSRALVAALKKTPAIR